MAASVPLDLGLDAEAAVSRSYVNIDIVRMVVRVVTCGRHRVAHTGSLARSY